VRRVKGIAAGYAWRHVGCSRSDHCAIHRDGSEGSGHEHQVAVAGVAVAGVAVAGIAVAGVASGSTEHSSRTRTVTVPKTVLATTTQPGVRAFVSSRGEVAGPYVARPASLSLIPASPSNAQPPATKAVHLRWVDWGQPVAFATGDILYKPEGSNRFEAYPGALVFYNLMACGSAPTYYYTTVVGFPRSLTYYDDGESSLARPCG
jgi:hypothetical protein